MAALGRATETDEARETWQIDGDREATWALRKMAEAQTEADRIQAAYDDELDRLTHWRLDALAGPQRDLAYFEGQLIAYRLRLEDENPALAQTYKLPGGRITRRKGSVKVDVSDVDELVTWALDHDAALLRIEPAKSALAKLTKADDGALVSEDGERVPGASWVRGDDSYGVTLEGVA